MRFSSFTDSYASWRTYHGICEEPFIEAFRHMPDIMHKMHANFVKNSGPDINHKELASIIPWQFHVILNWL